MFSKTNVLIVSGSSGLIGPALILKIVSQYNGWATCPMHSDVISDKPGHCHKCGMKLVPMSQQNNQRVMIIRERYGTSDSCIV